MEDLVLSCLESRVEENRNLYARFLVGPFLKGDALTIATALRRVLLSSIESIGITALYIQGITHEFSTIVGVRESVLELSLNFQAIVLSYDKTFFQKKSFFDGPQIGYLQVQGPKIIYANDLKLPLGVKLVDPTQYIATVSKEGSVVLKFLIGKRNDCSHQNESHFINSSSNLPTVGELVKKNLVRAKKTYSYKNGFTINRFSTKSWLANLQLVSNRKQNFDCTNTFFREETYTNKTGKIQTKFLLINKKTSFRRSTRRLTKQSFVWRSNRRFVRINVFAKAFWFKYKSFYKYAAFDFAPLVHHKSYKSSQTARTYKSPICITEGVSTKTTYPVLTPKVIQIVDLYVRATGTYKASLTNRRFDRHTKLRFVRRRLTYKSLICSPYKALLCKAYKSTICKRSFVWRSNLQFGAGTKALLCTFGAAHARPFRKKVVGDEGNKNMSCTKFVPVTRACTYKSTICIKKIYNKLCTKKNCFAKQDKKEKQVNVTTKKLKFLSGSNVFKSATCLRNVIPLDFTLTPVLKVNFVIEVDDEVLYLRQKIRERIILEVWTNGSIHPRQAVHDATLCLTDMFASFRSIYQGKSYSLSSPKLEPLNKKINKNFRNFKHTLNFDRTLQNTISRPPSNQLQLNRLYSGFYKSKNAVLGGLPRQVAKSFISSFYYNWHLNSDSKCTFGKLRAHTKLCVALRTNLRFVCKALYGDQIKDLYVTRPFDKRFARTKSKKICTHFHKKKSNFSKFCFAYKSLIYK